MFALDTSESVQVKDGVNYSFDYGNAHFNVFGVNEPELMNEWAKVDIANSDKTWKFGVQHFPVYYAGPNGTLVSFLNRLFYSTSFSKTMKVGAAVVSCRRGGASSTFDVLNKYFSELLNNAEQFANNTLTDMA